jgi:hypothetical protein
MLADNDLPHRFEVVLLPSEPLDPVDSPAQSLEALAVLSQSGATLVNVKTINRSLEHYLEQLQALSELFGMSIKADGVTVEAAENV